VELGVEDRVDLSGLVAAGVACGLLAVVVGPASAVGDDVGVVAGEEVADDRLEGVQLAGGGVHESGAEVVSESEVAVGRLGLADALRVAAGAVVLFGGAQLVGVQGGAGEERLLPGDLVILTVGEVVVDEVDDERGVDDPDGVGEVLAALVDVGVASGAGAVAGFGGDGDLERLGLGAGGEGVEFGVEFAGFACEDPGELLSLAGGEVRAGVLDVVGGVEQGAVVDPDGVGVVVFDEGAVHEAAEVAQRLVVQVGGGDAPGDRVGELGRDLVHVGEPVGHRDRQLRTGGAFGDAVADRVGEGELAAEVVRAFGGDAQIGADGGDPVVFVQAGAGVPAVGELGLLVCE